jgi:hypothetical protein
VYELQGTRGADLPARHGRLQHQPETFGMVRPGRPVDFGVTTGCGTFHHAMTISKQRSHYVLFGADRGGLPQVREDVRS